ncbi:MAG: response regulator transcription factor [Magnetospirillum sp.]
MADETAPLIAIVDDDPLFRETLAGNLGDVGYRVAEWPDGESFLAQFSETSGLDLVLLDWKMPGLNGIDVLRRMRAVAAEPPVIFLTVLSEQIFEEAALMGGAVDFIEKSRSFTIVAKRIELILAGRRAEDNAAPPSRVAVGELVLDLDSRRARWRGKPVELTLSEFALAHALASKPGRDVGYRDLHEACRGKGFHAGAGDDGYRANVRAAVKRLREKFKAVDPDFDAIGNYPGFGYNWGGAHGDAD